VHQPPTVRILGSYKGIEGSPVHFKGLASDSDGEIKDIVWTFGDYSNDTRNDLNATHAYNSRGTYNVTLFAVDDHGETVTATTTVTISLRRQAPVAESGGPYETCVGDAVWFEGRASYDYGGTIKAYRWDFGDGKIGFGPTSLHAYKHPGIYKAKLTVTDDIGTKVTNTTKVTIGLSPVITGITPSSVVVGKESFTLTVNGRNFEPGAVISVGSSQSATTFVNSRQLTTTVPGIDQFLRFGLEISVMNPSRRSGGSDTRTLMVTKP